MKFNYYLPLILFFCVTGFLFYKSINVQKESNDIASQDLIFNIKNYSSLLHNQPVNPPKEKYIMHVFSSWCSTCAENHINLMNMREQKIKILGAVWQDSRENILKMLQKKGNPYYDLILLDENDIINLGISGIPEIFIIGEDNKILYKSAGVLKLGDLKNAFYAKHK